MITYDKPKYGIIKESCSRFYPGAKVKIFAYVESVDNYAVKSVDGQIECMIDVEDVEIVDADNTAHI